jgi:hypothetical protein
MCQLTARFSYNGISFAIMICTANVVGCMHHDEPVIGERSGIVFSTSTLSCLSIRNGSLSAGSPLQVIDPSTQRVVSATVAAASDACIEPGAPSEHGYSMSIKGNVRSPFVGIGLVGDVGVRSSGGVLSADIEGDRHEDFFRLCTSQEGVHLTIWSEAALTGRRRWHRYHPLGYDVEPTCTPAETLSGDEQ